MSGGGFRAPLPSLMKPHPLRRMRSDFLFQDAMPSAQIFPDAFGKGGGTGERRMDSNPMSIPLHMDQHGNDLRVHAPRNRERSGGRARQTAEEFGEDGRAAGILIQKNTHDLAAFQG